MSDATAYALSGTTLGVEAILVQVEVDLAAQLPGVATVGLALAAVKEAKDRVRSAIRNSGVKFPPRKVTVNLAPADVPKNGTAHDLPIAVAMLAAAGMVRRGELSQWVMLGELALDGSLRPVSGVLPVALAARRAGKRGLVVAEKNGEEAASIAGLEVVTATSLSDVIDFLNGMDRPRLFVDLEARLDAARPPPGNDLSSVRGHSVARRALEVAAAGGHNLLLSGPPGSGKTMLARCLPGILPPMSPVEALEVTAIHSVAGMLPDGGVVTRRPFRSPHPTCRPQALIGGGRPLMPGEVTLAHRGVLFLDEFPELDRDSLEALRGPLEDREVHLSRAGRRIRFPASFTLVAAMNPCPCGHAGSDRCSCPITRVDRYVSRLSGPLLDRIDLFARIDALRGEEFDGPAPETSEQVRERVVEARARARSRAMRLAISGACNAEIPAPALDVVAALSPRGWKMLGAQMDRGLSARARDRAVRIARTLADLDGATTVSEDHLAEAMAFRPIREAIAA